MGHVIGVGGARAPSAPRPFWRVAPAAAGAVLLAIIVADSTARASWVAGSTALPGLALVAALAGCLVAVMGVRTQRAIAFTALGAPAAAYYSVVTTHTSARRTGGELIEAWWHALLNGRPAADTSSLLFVLCILVWLLVVWLVWGVLRWRQPLIGVAPAGAALATNVLNFPDGQDAYVFWFLVITFALLLWSTYHSSLASAALHRMELSDGARWDFWERGAVAMAALVALGVLIPPLSGVDQTLKFENDLARSWGQFTHGAGSGPGGLPANSIGFSTDVPLSGSIKQTSGVVFSYSAAADAVGPHYFRGASASPRTNDWRFQPGPGLVEALASGRPLNYTEFYTGLQRTSYKMDMLRPPGAQPNLLFYPGQLASVNREVQVTQLVRPGSGGGFNRPFETIDQVTTTRPRGSYTVDVDQSTATVDELREAGSSYPDWVSAYRGLPSSYRTPEVRGQIHALAVQVTAGAGNTYDQATAIETYLRDNYSYTLDPGAPWPGQDPLEYFLFTNRAGYCQYFATAMADMLRTLGVPTRLVNGYGPGKYDARQNKDIVRESDAHTWPEVYFPGYGWIPFEPTPDGTYNPIPRGTGAAGSSETSGGAGTAPAPAAEPSSRPDRARATQAPGRGLGLPSLRTWTPVAAVLLLVLVLLYVAVSRYLRPETVAGVWRRATRLSQLAGVRRGMGETPIEFGDRVAGEFPEAAAAMRRLAFDFTVAAYAPRGLAEQRKPAVMASWAELRTMLLRRVASRLVPDRLAQSGQAGTASPV
ncbi:MAG TPA: transglutaminase domain-containing protein [Candidatus Dormibacteraeota bacterium]|nr:transglutaminase domain-containing protein [Candidatus Dormibacteraeota bacterium]